MKLRIIRINLWRWLWRLIEWNPRAMRLSGDEVSIEFAQKEPPIEGFINPPVRVGDRIMTAINWQSFDSLVMYPGSGALVFDPSSSEAPELIEDSRVGGGFKIDVADDGDAYLTGLVGGDVRQFGSTPNDEPMPTSGLVRIGADAQGFDPEYLVDVDAITGTPGIWAIHRIDDRYLLVQMWDPETPTKDFQSADDLNGASEYIYAIVDTEDKSWTRVDAIPKAGAGNALDHIVDGRLYVQAYVQTGPTPDDADAVVYSVTPEGFEEAFRVPSGDLWFVRRLR